MSLYLDASAIIPLFVWEKATAPVEALIGGARDWLIVSEFAAAEVASGISRLVRTGFIAEAPARRLLGDFDRWRTRICREFAITQPDLHEASRLVRRFELGLRAPDALHLALCRRAGATIVTLDARLAGAAGALGLEVAPLV